MSMKHIGCYSIPEEIWKDLTVGFMIRNFFRPDAFELLLRAIHGEDEQ